MPKQHKNQYASISLTSSKFSYSDQDVIASMYIEAFKPSGYNQLKLAFVAYRKYKLSNKQAAPVKVKEFIINAPYITLYEWNTPLHGQYFLPFSFNFISQSGSFYVEKIVHSQSTIDVAKIVYKLKAVLHCKDGSQPDLQFNLPIERRNHISNFCKDSISKDMQAAYKACCTKGRVDITVNSGSTQYFIGSDVAINYSIDNTFNCYSIEEISGSVIQKLALRSKDNTFTSLQKLAEFKEACHIDIGSKLEVNKKKIIIKGDELAKQDIKPFSSDKAIECSHYIEFYIKSGQGNDKVKLAEQIPIYFVLSENDEQNEFVPPPDWNPSRFSTGNISLQNNQLFSKALELIKPMEDTYIELEKVVNPSQVKTKEKTVTAELEI